MKRLNAILVLIALVVCCFSCKKDPQDVNEGQITITEESQFVKDNDTIYAELLAVCKYHGTINQVVVQVGFAEDLSDATLVAASKTDAGYVAAFPVQADTVYYYRYVVHRYSTEFDQTTEWEDDTVYQLLTDDLRLPSVTTNAVKFVSTNSAMGCGTVTEDDGLAVIERGFCWGTQLHPTIRDHYSSNGDGVGDFYMEMKNLESGQKYYARAYARNNQGIVYGRPFDFMTQTEGPLSVNTLDPTEIEECSANLSGELVFTSSASVFISYGFLYGLTPNTVFVETIAMSIIDISMSGTGLTPQTSPFNRVVSTLENNTKYYVRAFAIDLNNHDTIIGEMKSFYTKVSPLEPPVEPNDAFSVSPTLQVQFSPGNLQYQASTNTWRFAEHQWDYVGEGNTNISPTYDGWIDLFGWGTSGYGHGAVCYQPWSTSCNGNDYYAYGQWDYNLNDRSGQADWGYNAINNGGNHENQWFTLSSEEWLYVFGTRNTSSGIRYVAAKVNGVNGLLLLPDDWEVSYYALNNTNPAYNSWSFEDNIITAEDWISIFELNGVVFLPTAGGRLGTSVWEVGTMGFYWSSTISSATRAMGVHFANGDLYYHQDGDRYDARSVRLVRPLE